MSVCNVKVKFIRPKYENLEQWMNDPDNIYIGRRGIVFINKERFPKKDSLFANPFKVDKKDNTSRETVISQYKKYIIHRIINEPLFKEEFFKLKGKNLGCWCKDPSNPDIACHGDVLLHLLETFVQKT
jgi:hypothetical protein